MIAFGSADRRTSRPWRLLIGLQVSLLVFTLMAPIGTIAAEIQTDLWVYNDGDTVTVTGIEYGPNEPVEIVTTDPAGSEVDRGTVQADATGSITYPFILHVTVPGIYDVVGTGLTTGLTAATQFDPPPNTPPANLRFVDQRDVTSGVLLTWDRSSSGSVDCYFVYRSTSAMAPRTQVPGDNFCSTPPARPGRIAVVNQPASGAVTFTDATATSGQPYFYFLTAVKDGNNQGESISGNQVATTSLATAPAALSFGTQIVGTASAAQSITITNNGLGTITFRSITKAGANQADFSVTGAPAAGTSFAPAASFTFAVTFTPGAVGSRSAALSVNASDPAHSAPAIFNSHQIGVTGTGANVNTPPNANDDSATVAEDAGPTVIDVLANDNDVDGDSLSVTGASDPAHGSTLASVSGVTYTPDPSYCGPDSFTYSISDGHGGTDTATVNVSITCVNDAPVANPDSATVPEDSGETPIDVLANDTDIDGGPLSVTGVTQPGHGTATSTSTGVAYEPDDDYCGPDSFTYSISDGHGGSATGSVSVVVTCANDAPVANPDSATVAEDSDDNAIDVLANDTDLDGDSLDVTAAGPASHGTVALSAGGVTYTADPNYCGPDSFSYTIADGNGGTASATVSVDITCVNDAPVVIVSGNVDAAPEGTTRTYTYTITDLDSGSFSVVESCGAEALYIPTVAANSFDCKFLDGPGSSVVNVTADDGGTVNNLDDDPHTVSINNVAPTTAYSTGPATVSESGVTAHTYVFSVSDPGDDTVIGSGTGCGVGGLPDLDTADVYTDTTVTFDCIFPDGPADYVIQANATDSDNATGPFSFFTVHADNVAPTTAYSTGPATVSESGVTAHTYVFSVSDPGDDTVIGSGTGCGVGGLPDLDTADVYTDTTVTFDCIFPDGPADYVIQANATDSDNATGPFSFFTVHADNVAPTTAYSTGPATVSESGVTAHTYVFSVSDPGDDTVIGSGTGCGVGGLPDLDTADVYTDTTVTFDCIFPDGPADYVIQANATDSDNATGPFSFFTVHADNVAPTTAYSTGPATVSESGVTAHTYVFSVSDPGDDTVIGSGTGCGVGGLPDLDTADVYTDTTVTFDCIFPDGPADYVIQANATDSDNATGPFSFFTVHADNVAPTVTISAGFASASEGDPATPYEYTFTDPGADSWTRNVSCGVGGTVSEDDFQPASKSGSFKCAWADDNPTGTASDDVTVSVPVTDEDTGTDTESRIVTVNNIDPSVGTVVVSFNPVTHVATATAGFTDQGVLDTISASTVTWNVVGSASTITAIAPAGATPGSVTGTIVLPTGCYPLLTATITVTDDDTGTTSLSGSLSGSADAYAATFRPPIKDNERNIVKFNNVLPVKVVLNSSCVPGTTVTAPNLYVTLSPGSGGELIEDTNVVVDSLSAADTGQKMRVADGGYIYNLSLKGLGTTSDYTIRIRLGGATLTDPVILDGVIRPKK